MRPDAEDVAVAVFAALADPMRRAVLARLAEHGPSTATELASALSITRQGIAKHLALLADAALVTAEPGHGRRVLHRHRTAPIKVAQSYLAALAAGWDDALDRLSDSLDDLEEKLTMTGFGTTLTVDQSPDEVPAAVTDVRGWWTGQIDGPTAAVGDEFTYRYEDLHRSVQRVRSTHVGLSPDADCCEACSNAWSWCVGQLRQRITAG